jgi:hypothetical protein
MLQSAGLPVILTPRGFTVADNAVVQRITCAVSGSEHSPLLAEQAGEIAATFGVSLRLATFIVRDKQMYPTGVGYSAENQVANQLRVQAQAAHDAIQHDWHSPVVLSSVLGDGEDWKSALGSIDWEETELLIIGSSDRGQLMRVFRAQTPGRLPVLPPFRASCSRGDRTEYPCLCLCASVTACPGG